MLTTPDTDGYRAMAITVAVDSEADVPRVVGWVQQFESVDAIGSWNRSTGCGDVAFVPSSLEQATRVIGYVASWEGETTPTAAYEDCGTDRREG